MKATIIGALLVLAIIGVVIAGGTLIPGSPTGFLPLIQPPPAFYSRSQPVSASERQAMLKSGSWHTGCPLAINQLRVLNLNYWGFDDRIHVGQLMVNQAVVNNVTTVFQALFQARYPIHQMQLVDHFKGKDELSMLADNTSGYNCRRSPIDGSWSLHAYGLAIDINPFENPEIIHRTSVDPSAARSFADRSRIRKGMITPGDAAVVSFASLGWGWGGTWQAGWQDWQHFYLPSPAR